MRIRTLLLLAVLCLVPHVLLAHGGPKKVIGDYVVSLGLVPQGDAMLLRFDFALRQTGAPLEGAVRYDIRVETDRGELVSQSEWHDARGGTAETTYTFPRGGYYELFLRFETEQNPGVILEPQDWSVRIPGPNATEDWCSASFPVPASWCGWASDNISFLIAAALIGAVLFSLAVWRWY